MFMQDKSKDIQKELMAKLPFKDLLQNTSAVAFQGGIVKNQSFYRKDMNRFETNNTTFQNCSFYGAACDASRFYNTTFISCDFSGATFQDARFINCVFKNKCFAEAMNFSRSMFIGCQIYGFEISLSTLHQCYFEQCQIIEGTYNTCTLDGTKFIKCNMSDIDLSHLNLEFVTIEDLSFDGSVTLPPYQIAYIINGMQYAINNLNTYDVQTDDGKVNGSYFVSQIPLLDQFYRSKRMHFPLANVLLGKGQTEDALKEIQIGIEESLDLKDFRMVKNYCCLLKETPSISISEKQKAYKKITSYADIIDLNREEYYLYIQYIGQVKELLINNVSNQSRLEIVINTDFEENDLNHVYELYKFFMYAFEQARSEQHIDFIEIRHNSPFQIALTYIDSIPEIIGILAFIYGVISKGIPKILDIVQQCQEIYSTNLENKHKRELNSLDKEEKQLDIQKKHAELQKIMLENKGLENELELSTPTILGINEIRHTISCNSVADTNKIPRSILMGTHKRSQ